MPIDPSIALAGKFLELNDPLSAYAKALQVKVLKQESDINQQSLIEKENLARYLSGVTDIDAPEVNKALMTGYGKTGIDYAKSLDERRLADINRQKSFGDLVDASMKRSRDELQYVKTPEEYITWHERNHKDPILGKYFKQRGINVGDSINRISEMLNQPGGFEQLKRESALGLEKSMEQNYISQNYGGGTRVLGIPKYSGGVPVSATAVPGSDITVTKSPNAPQTNINNKIEGAYGQTFGKKTAERDIALMDAAVKAPDIIANADRILDLLETGKTFTGTGADIRLQIARLIGTGKDDNEKVANTQDLISGLAKNTLGSVKNSGLGPPFSDVDRKFLEQAVSGQINYTSETLKRLANLSRKAGEETVNAWNKRVKELPKSAVEGTNISTEKIKIPNRTKKEVKVPSVGTVKNGYKFLGGDPSKPGSWKKVSA